LLDDSSLPKTGEEYQMPILKEIAFAGAALVLFLFISAAVRSLNENDQIQHSITNWIGAGPVPAERLLAKDSITSRASRIDAVPADPSVTPGERIRKAFAQFAPDKRKNTI
jgi:hypothetical protein